MAIEILYPASMPKQTPEQVAEAQRLIAEARAAGNPLTGAGTLPEDELTDEWLAAMREYRKQVEEDPNY